MKRNNVLLVDADSKTANLPLMKLSQHHKQKDDTVFLKRGLAPELPLDCLEPDKIYISCIFTKNAERALDLSKQLSSRNFDVEIGGSGVDLEKELPHAIEHAMPDYTLYGIQHSIGFTSRGCIRKCPWCIVWRKEGKIRDHARICEFYDPTWHRLLLYDNNFLAAPSWRKTLQDIHDNKIKVCFNQGLDIRLIDNEIAELLSKLRYYDDQFKRRRLYLSYDLSDLEPVVSKGIELLKKHGIRPRHQMWYVLTGYGEADEAELLTDALWRLNLLIDKKVLPFVMLYNNRNDMPYLRHLARWINGRYYMICSYEEYLAKHL